MRSDRVRDRRLVVASLGALLGVLGVSSGASAEPLKLSELNEFNVWVQCSEACGELPPAATFEQQRIYFQCESSCGNAPRLWEKDGIAPTNRRDLELAILETQHAAQPPDAPLVCYQGEAEEIVVRGALCAESVCEAQPLCSPQQCALPETAELDCTEDEPGGARCWWPSQVRPPFCPDVVCEANPTRDEASCSDVDADGVPRWLEQETGRSDLQAEAFCGGLEACAFDQRCALDAELGRGQCEARECPGGVCPLFHLEVISQDDQQALVWVYFDHAALPTRVLDLYLSYDREALVLEDARRLPALSFYGKELRSTHLSDGTLRLSVFDTGNTDPIRQGPIIELVFRRTAEEAGEIAFTDDAGLRGRALAPAQGDAQATLGEGRWWGPGRTLTPRSELGTRLALWYGFEQLASPLSYAAIPSAEALCADIAACANEEDPALKAQQIALLAQLQRGALAASHPIEGVVAGGVYLDGENDHLRLPVSVQRPYEPGAQHLSFSTWFYTEGNTADELRDSPQLLYTHNGFDERTRWGLLLRPSEEGGMDLAFFRGDLLSKTPPPEETVIAARLGLREWHHVALTLDASSGETTLYFDGEPTARVTLPQPPAAVACPQLINGTDLQLHQEGEILGGKPNEYVYMGVARGGLYKIDRMNLQGSTQEEVLGSGEFSYRDPDYSPALDKVAFTSNASGSFEVWVANGDGSNPQQVTVGFGDSSRSIRARRPRWSPDGSALLFESNIYDVVAGDNAFARVYHIYYIGFDAVGRQPAVELAGGGVARQLIYRDHLRTQTLNLYRLTDRDPARNHTSAAWLEGRSAGQRGVIVMETSSEKLDGQRVEELTIAQNIPSSQVRVIEGLGEAGQEVELLAAHRSVRPAVPTPIETRRLFFKRGEIRYEAAVGFTVTERPVAGGVELVVEHAPAGYDPRCWDRNANAIQDGDEDNNNDGRWDEADCYPYEVRNLFVEFDPTVFRPTLVDASGAYQTPGELLLPTGQGGVHKELQLQDVYPLGRSMVRVEVLSPYNALPIPAGEVAVLRLERVGAGAPSVAFGAFGREATEELLVQDLTRAAPPVPFDPAGRFELVEEAHFSPGGDALLLAAVSQARPILLRSDSLTSAADAARVSREDLRLRGMSWVRQDSYYPCGWSGAYLHPYTKQVVSSLRGGLDDMKVYYGLRDAESIRSEAERGLERLEREGRRSGPSFLAEACSSNADCAAYHLCVNGECAMVDCDPEDPYTCLEHGGSCVQRPLSVEQENAALLEEDGFFDWVCATDCASDRQCFTQECLNGPCRFCDTVAETCVECRYAETDFGAFTIAGIEGCPDRNSFACVEGACVTECYAFEDGESRYLCDPATEYCSQGRCVLLDWAWQDLAPASFGGLSDSRYRLTPDVWAGYSAAVGERYTVSLYAYGVEDYVHAPELVVEALGGPVFGSTWTRLGRVQVHNVTRAQGMIRPVVLESPYPFESLRVRMITPPYQNITAAATGLGAFDRDFCVDDLRKSAAARGEDPAAADLSPCYRRAPGSLASVGYRVGIPLHEAIAACRERGHAGCPSLSRGESDYFLAGSSAVILSDVQVDGASVMNTLVQDTVCTYEGGLSPLDAGRPRRLFYGDITTEQSNAQAAFCAENPAACAAPTAAVLPFPAEARGFALLNCNLYDPASPVAGSAQVVFDGITIVREWPARSGAVVFDNGDTCRVELDALRSTPCFEWDTDASVDAYNDSTDPWGTLEFGLFRSFGHDEGFTSLDLPRHPLSVRVRGYDGDGLAFTNRGEELEVGSAGPDQTVTFTNAVPEGFNYEVVLTRQPSQDGHRCVITGRAAGRMPAGGATVEVTCFQRHPLGGVAQGLAPGVVAQLALVSLDERGVVEVDTLDVAADGPFAFAPGVLAGGEWSAQVLQQPRGQRCTLEPAEGVMGSAPDSSLTLTCADLPVHTLRVSVAGLRGAGGLVLRERASDQEITVDASGSAAFPELIQAGEPYDLAILQQPTTPAQLCTFDGAQAGVMPDADHVGARITCAPSPTFAVTATVVGLEGAGLRVSFNDGLEILDVPRPVIQSDPSQITFTRRLLRGEPYRVTVVQQPNTPQQLCQVYQGEGVIDASDTTDMQVLCRRVSSNASYALRGTVTGLFGQDLVLINGFGTERVEIDENGAFAFPTTVADGSDYRVTVDRQPREPAQRCRVFNGSGTVRGADITDLQVACGEGSTVSIELDRSDADGAHVEVYITSPLPEARVVATGPQDLTLEGGRASFVAQAAEGSGPAILEAGSYEVFVFVNKDGSVDRSSGRPTFSTADLGSRRSLILRANADNPVRFYASDFTPLVAPEVRAQTSLSIEPDAILACLFAPAGAGQQALPQEDGAPVIARAVKPCMDGEECFARPSAFDNFRRAITTENQAMPRGLYDITCHADEDADGMIDPGEFVGFLGNVPIGSQPVSITLQEAP